jgi:uncharacterized protein YdaU (DUF1376 family)
MSAWMPIYWGDYFKDTLGFSAFQHGCYLVLIGAYWTNGGPLKDDRAELAAMCGTSSDKLARYGKRVLAKFTCKDGLLYHERIEIELLKASNRQAAAVANGRAGGIARAKLPTTIPTTTEVRIESKIMDSGLVEGGKRANRTAMSEENKLSHFHNWLAPFLGPQGWAIIGKAMDPANPDFELCMKMCREVARTNGKGWPHQWPKKRGAQ